MILANLRKAGVQNTVKGERLVFDRLDSWPGVYVQASGEYTENGQSRTVAVALGPQFGTVARNSSGTPPRRRFGSPISSSSAASRSRRSRATS